MHEDTVTKYNLKGLPVFGLFVAGKLIASHSGALNKEKMRDLIDNNLPK